MSSLFICVHMSSSYISVLSQNVSVHTLSLHLYHILLLDHCPHVLALYVHLSIMYSSFLLASTCPLPTHLSTLSPPTICTSSFYITVHHVLSLSVPLSVMSYSFTCVHIVFLICTCVHMSSSDTSDYSVLHKHCSVPCLLPLSLSPLYSFSSFIYITVHHLSSYIFVHHFGFLHVCSEYSFTVFAMSSSFTCVQCPLPMFLSTVSPPIHTAFFLYHNHTLLPHLCPPCPFLTSVHHVIFLYICLL